MNKLETRIKLMKTSQIKETLSTMNEKPSERWSEDEMTVENALIWELLDRNEDAFVAGYEASMN